MIPRGPLGDAFSDPNLLGTAIAGDTWNSWRTLLIAAMSEDLSEDERETFTHLTGRGTGRPSAITLEALAGP